MNLKKILRGIFNKSSAEKAVEEIDPATTSKIKQLFSDIADEASTGDDPYSTSYKLSDLDSYQSLKEQEAKFKRQFLMYLVKKMSDVKKEQSTKTFNVVSYQSISYKHQLIQEKLVSLMLRWDLDLQNKDLENIIDWVRPYWDHSYGFPFAPLVSIIEKRAAENGLDKLLKTSIKKLMFTGGHYGLYADEKKINHRLSRLLSDKPSDLISAKDNFGVILIQHLDKLTKEELVLWERLIGQLTKGKSSSTPTKKWLSETSELLDGIPATQLESLVAQWLQLPVDLLKEVYKQNKQAVLYIQDSNLQILRGLVWATGLKNNTQWNTLVEELGLWCFKKIPGHGPFSVKIGNACLQAFSMLPFDQGISRLTTFRVKIKYPSVRSQIERIIFRTAEKNGKSIDEIEELGVPTFGLDHQNQYQQVIGGFQAQIHIVSTHKTEITWKSPSGKIQKSIPAAIKTDHGESLKLLKKKAKEIQTAVPVHRDRIESFYLKKRAWQYPEWSKNYHQHPLISFLSKDLIWEFEEEGNICSGLYHEGRFIDVNQEEITWLSANTTVKLWHPIGKNTQTIVKWREFLMEHQIKQPFKQAFREVYLITDAELETESYSNRFAAHILRQHQFSALCQVRGWRYSLMGQWDSANTPTIIIPSLRMRAEFWVDGNWNNDDVANDLGVFLYIFTDQVRFYDIERQLNMDEVPQIVFSEIMRDVDLFVGVTSIGNDPNWVDGGLHQYNEYWESYSFGTLSESSKMRKDVLQQLIPKLKIASVCHFDGNFLVVEGKIRIYKIHIGSGNILMKPNDQYLCIVPGRKPKDKIYLPFEGDNLLSIIISKAILLASDHKITDRSILRQINS